MLKMSWTRKGSLEIVDTNPFEPWAYRYVATRTGVHYATLDRLDVENGPTCALNAVRAWIAENPGPPGHGGYRPAVYINGCVYALDYNDWVALRGWS